VAVAAAAVGPPAVGEHGVEVGVAKE